MSTYNTSAESLTTNPYLARLRSALTKHNTAQSNFGKDIWDELEVISCEVLAGELSFFQPLIARTKPTEIDTHPSEGKEFSTVLARPTKGEKLTPTQGVVTTVGEAEGGKGKRGRVVIEATIKKGSFSFRALRFLVHGTID